MHNYMYLLLRSTSLIKEVLKVRHCVIEILQAQSF